MIFILSRGHAPSPFFRLASNAFPDIGSVGRLIGRIEKKKLKKKSQEVSE